ncbi:MAG: DUF3291 domain-containing protein [Pseudomonadota bacterium]
MSEFHIAQLNIASMKYAADSMEMSGFMERLEDINALADESPGFVWRLQTEAGDATSIDFFGPTILVNMSVWEDIDLLHHYVYRSAHNQVLARRKEWFDPIEKSYAVLWWVPAGHIPTIEEAGERLELLRAEGPGPEAFTFKQRFDPA